MIRVTVWNEFIHEKEMDEVKKIYPDGIHAAIADFLGKEEDIEVRCATLDMEECGLTQEVIDNTDVLLWWGHCAHGSVPDEIVDRVQEAVLKGMGMIFLHSAHHSKPFRRLMGTTCSLKWRDGDRERLWCINPSHPIAKGVPENFNIPVEEMYGERFDIPTPDELLMIGTYTSHEVFRSACTWQRGYGKIFYFQPGHETDPTYKIPEVQTIIKNAVQWAKPALRQEITCPRYEKIKL